MSCVMIFSDKSSGSSILQKELTKHPDIRSVIYTRHFENETLFWVKAAAILGMPQPNLKYSEVPFDNKSAIVDLSDFLKMNIPNFRFEKFDKEAIFFAWTSLCKQFGPLFIEKSPHHLHVRSSIQLISEYIESKVQDVKIIGIIRNPMDTLYSSWKRWGAIPELCQYDWHNAYKNLIDFKKQHPDRCMIVRYEDFVSDNSVMDNICDFLCIKKTDNMGSDLHDKSRGKWKKDKFYGFKLAPEIFDFSRQFGYADVNNNSTLFWQINKIAHIAKVKIKILLSKYKSLSRISN